MIVTYLLAALILWGTLSPVEATQGTVPHLDKLVHFGAFAALGLPCALFYRSASMAVFFAALMMGGAIELIQPYVGRSAEWLDLLADSLGSCVPLILARILNRR